MEIPLPVETDYSEEILGSDLSDGLKLPLISFQISKWEEIPFGMGGTAAVQGK